MIVPDCPPEHEEIKCVMNETNINFLHCDSSVSGGCAVID